jgi:undecaprenyl-diphosphatase
MKDMYKKPMFVGIVLLVVLVISFFIDNLFLDFSSGLIFPVLEYMFSFLTNIVFVILVLLVYPTIMLWHERKEKWILPLWTAFWVVVAITFILKVLVQRSRPISDDGFLAILVYSFPSTHTACAFSVLPVLNYVFRREMWLWTSLVVLIGLSRLYLQVHYLSDVLAGALIGYSIGWVVIYMKERYL